MAHPTQCGCLNMLSVTSLLPQPLPSFSPVSTPAASNRPNLASKLWRPRDAHSQNGGKSGQMRRPSTPTRASASHLTGTTLAIQGSGWSKLACCTGLKVKIGEEGKSGLMLPCEMAPVLCPALHYSLAQTSSSSGHVSSVGEPLLPAEHPTSLSGIGSWLPVSTCATTTTTTTTTTGAPPAAPLTLSPSK
ncbi:uncharacterized protein IWZ02DRAFT_7876 [Phyllosticta citriasiana]|uniref:uncharacterized protein n=1 Tax=Phyllosticta citriasiana TaxID=595635 RepID=UPI0030FDE5A7